MAAAVERSVKAILKAEVSNYVQPMAQAQKATEKVTQAAEQIGPAARRSFADVLAGVDKNSAAINGLSLQLGLLGGAMVGFAALAVSRAADFDEAMSGVAAATMESVDNMALLRQAALNAGADTQYTATEAARAIRELAKAGVSTADILKGGLRGALNLAASGQMELADAAAVTSTVMNQFRLKGDQASHIADVLAASAGKANGEVSDFGQAMKYVGPVASQLGISLEETAGTLALLAQNGILADNAGTGLRGVLMALTAPTDQAQKALDRYGISIFDARGEFVGLEAMVGQMHTKLGGLTEAERSAALGQIFGNHQITTARILYNEGAAAVANWTEKVNDSGYAAEQARIQTDNLKGDIERLGGSLDTALIQGGTGANEALRGIVRAAEAVVDGIGKIPAPILGILTMITGSGGLAILGVAGIMKLATSVASAKTAFDTLGIGAGKAKVAVSLVGGALAVGALAFTVWATQAANAQARTEGFLATLDEAGNRTDATIRQISEALSKPSQSWLQGLFHTGGKSIIDMAEESGIAIDDLTGYILGEAEAIERVTTARKAYWAASEDGPLGANEVDQFIRSLDEQASSLSEAEKQAAQKARADEAAGLAAEGAASGMDAAAAAAQAEAEAMQVATQELEAWRQTVGTADAAFVDLAGLYDGIIQKNRDYAQSTADATKDSSDSWETYYDGVSVSKDDYIAGLEAQVAAQAAWEQNILDISSRVKDGLSGDMRTAAEAMIDELIAMGPEGAAQVQMLHDMSEPEFEKVVQLWSQKGTSAVSEFVSQVEAYRQPEMALLIDTVGAQGAVDKFYTDNNGRKVSFVLDARIPGGVVYNTPGGPVKMFANAGPVVGPGTATSDSIPARLSNGEHVLSAAEVVGLGGHGAVAALRAAARTGAWTRRAEGGPIGYASQARYAMPVWPSVAQSGSAAAGARAVEVTQHITTSDPIAAGIVGARYMQRLVT